MAGSKQGTGKGIRPRVLRKKSSQASAAPSKDKVDTGVPIEWFERKQIELWNAAFPHKRIEK